ncbi:hypothetical protein [Clostridium sp. ZBS14]|uniref:hypothetical protein n=1 Tax=Clostridium sp. ZBS14 TaxID=2949970 RepID=UPI00207A31A3|nr:hypothetical protein [Clostridium sp. ZBS14]
MENLDYGGLFWNFSPLKSIEEANFNGALERFYKLGIAGFVRENIQNSLDGKLQGLDEPVIVEIKTGSINKNDIPGFKEIKARVNSLKGYNEYTRETIDHMKKSMDKEEVYYISFEDSNTKGLTGAKNGQNNSVEDTWGIYAYKKGVHSIEVDSDIESGRGGSHGIGKIASNAASDLFMMFFANCDSENNKHLGGTIQLIEHEYEEKCYRATGYFTDIENNCKYIPFENKFSSEFSKDTRGLKIIIPFLREEFNDEKEIIKSICDGFFVAILEEKLEVKVNDKRLNKNTIKSYIEASTYYEQNISEIKKKFTPLYLNTYLNSEFTEIDIRSLTDVYKFKLYFQINSAIKKGRLGIIRTIGMKIEDKKIKNNATKPFNGVLIPCSIKEDAFLKLLENESHTEIEHQHIKDTKTRRNAEKFINNISNRLAEIINKKITEMNPTTGKMNTEDILYTIESKFKKDLKKAVEPVKIVDSEGVKKELTKDLGNKRKKINAGAGEKEPKTELETKPKKKLRRATTINNYSGDRRKEKRYNIGAEAVERVIIRDKEYIKFDLDNSEAEKKRVCDVALVVVDGMGEECFNEFNVLDNYKSVTDKNTGKNCLIKDNLIKDVSIKKGKVNIEVMLNEKANRFLKFVYYVEV